jgi:2-phospho-L-lactate guanylyltransferase
VLLADLPFVTAEAIKALLDRSTIGTEAVIAPGQRGGTHALLVRPPGWLQFAFGPDSFRQHTRRVGEAGARLVLYEESALAFDIDIPQDLVRALQADPGLLQRAMEHSG